MVPKRSWRIEAYHPALKPVDKTVNTFQELCDALDELEEHNYKIEIIPVTKRREFEVHVSINCRCGRNFKVSLNGINRFKCDSCGVTYIRYYDQKTNRYIIDTE